MKEIVVQVDSDLINFIPRKKKRENILNNVNQLNFEKEDQTC